MQQSARNHKVRFDLDQLSSLLDAYPGGFTVVALSMCEYQQLPEGRLDSQRKSLQRARKGRDIQVSTALAIAGGLDVALLPLIQNSSNLPKHVTEYIRSQSRPDFVNETADQRQSDRQQAALPQCDGPANSSVRSIGFSGSRALFAGLLGIAVVSAFFFLVNDWLGSSHQELATLPSGLVLSIGVSQTSEPDIVSVAMPLLTAELGSTYSLGRVVEIGSETTLAQRVLRGPLEQTLSLDFQFAGRFVVVNSSLLSSSRVVTIWSKSFPAAEMDVGLNELAVSLTRRIREELSGSGLQRGNYLGTADPVAFESFKSALLLLDRSASASVDDLSTASIQAGSALRRDPNFALAQALECRTLGLMYWVNSDRSFLQAAKDACEIANTRIPGHPLVHAAMGMVQTYTGELDKAISQLKNALVSHPESVDIGLMLSIAYGEQWQRGAGSSWLDLALIQLEQTIELEPDFWLSHFWYGTYLFYAGQMDEAQTSLEVAVDLNPNEIALANLGTFSLCLGDLDEADRVFKSMIELYPDNNLGPELESKVHHFRREYDQEIRSRAHALRTMRESDTPQIHEIYGGLGDAYFWAGQNAKAIESYRQAVSIVNGLSDLGTAGSNDLTAKAYYLSRLVGLGVANLEESLADAIRASEPGELDFRGHVWKAQVVSSQGRKDLAKDHWSQAIETCPLYRMHPAYQQTQIGSHLTEN